MSNSAHILFVFEGERAEGIISKKFIEYYFSVSGQSVVTTAFCGDIYQLIAKMKDDDFQLGSIDILPLLQEIPTNFDLMKFNRDNFSEVYLFFDYDPHATNASDEKVRELLDFFDEETEQGKLFISYPMVEATRCLSENCEKSCFYKLSVPVTIGSGFKKFSSEYASHKFNSVKSWGVEDWNLVVRMHCEKSNLMVRNICVFPAVNVAEVDVLNCQISYKQSTGSIYVLSSFPMMLASYYGVKKLKAIVTV